MKIADFGTSKRVTNTALRTICGTQGYVAPELLKILPRKFKGGEIDAFTYALDMWSLGCLVHELLTSQTPFRELPEDLDDTSEIESGFTTIGSEVDMSRLCDYCHGRIDFPLEALHSALVAQPGINFVKSLLVANPDERATATHALRHPWLANTDYVSAWYTTVEKECTNMGVRLEFPLDKSVIRRLRVTDIAEYIPRPGTTTLTDVLGQALSKNSYSIAAMVLNSPARRTEKNSAEDFEALFEQAVVQRQSRWVEVLLSSGRDVNRPLVSGKTALEVAVTDGGLEMVKVLLNHNAEADAEPTDGAGSRVLPMAVESGFAEIVALLLASKADVHSWVSGPGAVLLTAIDRKDTETVDRLLQHGADVNVEVDGRTPLQTAAKQGNITLVQLLLTHNCEVNSKPHGDSGLTPLQAAAWGGHLEVVTLLLANGAQINAEPAPTAGMTALQAAAEQGHLGVVKILISNGANIDAPPSLNGWTALQAAAKGGHYAIVKQLCDNGAYINAKPSRTGRTAIQAAAEHGHIDVAEILLAAGADVNASPSAVNGCNVLEVPVNDNNIAMVELLLRYHANARPNLSGVNGRKTLFDIATNKNHTEIVKLLSDNMAETSAKVIELLGLFADIVLSVILIFEQPRGVNHGQSAVNVLGSPSLRSIPRRLLRSVLNGTRIRDIPWTLLLTLNIYHPLNLLINRKERRKPSKYTNWAVITQTTLIRTAVALILTEGAAVKPIPSKYTTWPLFYVELFMGLLSKALLYRGRGQSLHWFFAGPIGTTIVRLRFIQYNAESLKYTSLAACLAGPLAEFVIALVHPHWAVDSIGSFNTVREQGLQQMLHLGYRHYRRAMATRRARAGGNSS